MVKKTHNINNDDRGGSEGSKWRVRRHVSEERPEPIFTKLLGEKFVTCLQRLWWVCLTSLEVAHKCGPKCFFHLSADAHIHIQRHTHTDEIDP